MQAVREAESALLAEIGPRPYLPMAGLAGYRDAVQALFGEQSEARAKGRIATLQTLGGSARCAWAPTSSRLLPQGPGLISDPSWENHRVVFERAGFTVQSYPYYDDATGGLKFDAMLGALRQARLRATSCCCTPAATTRPAWTSTREQWRQVIAVLKERGLLAFVDMAYQASAPA